MGWLIVFASDVIQPIIDPVGLGLFWGILLLGSSLISLSFIMEAKTISTHRATTLLQIGVVVTIIWVMILLQMKGPYDLGLPKRVFEYGRTLEDDIIHIKVISLLNILLLGTIVLGLILLSLGIVLNRRTKRTN